MLEIARNHHSGGAGVAANTTLWPVADAVSRNVRFWAPSNSSSPRRELLKVAPPDWFGQIAVLSMSLWVTPHVCAERRPLHPGVCAHEEESKQCSRWSLSAFWGVRHVTLGTCNCEHICTALVSSKWLDLARGPLKERLKQEKKWLLRNALLTSMFSFYETWSKIYRFLKICG